MPIIFAYLLIPLWGVWCASVISEALVGAVVIERIITVGALVESI
jgi:hypothetical protein